MSRGPESSYFTCDTAFKGVVIVDTIWLAALTYSHVQLRNEVTCLKEEVAKLQESCKQTNRVTSSNKTDISAAHKTLRTHNSDITSLRKKLRETDPSNRVSVEDFNTLTRQVELMVKNTNSTNVLSDLSSHSHKSTKRSDKKKAESESENSSTSSQSTSGSSSSNSEESFDPNEFNDKLNSISTPKNNASKTKPKHNSKVKSSSRKHHRT